MVTRFVKLQLVVFTVLSVIAFSLIAFVYTDVPGLLGFGRVEVTARFAKAAGLYPNANVTYRGYTIGKVTDVRLAPEGVEAVLSIDEKFAPARDSRAAIHSVSAIGEQYVDLIPGSRPAPSFVDGDVIPRSRTDLPVPVADVLDDTKTLLDTVRTDQLRTVLDEGSEAFRDLGAPLGRLLDDTDKLVDEANENYGPTELLIRDAGPVLDSQRASSPAIRSWTRDLNGFTRQLRASDGDLRSVLHTAPQAAEQAGDLLGRLQPVTPTLLTSANVLARLAKDYNAPIEQVLVVYPLFTAASQTLVPEHRLGAFNFNLSTTVNVPNCTKGWVPPGQPGGPRDSNALEDMALPGSDYCKLPQDDPAQARSARHLPCFEPGSPPGRRAATIYQCRGAGYRPDFGSAPAVPEPGELPGSGTQLPGPILNPLGVLGAPDSPPLPRTEDRTWQALLAPTAAEPK